MMFSSVRRTNAKKPECMKMYFMDIKNVLAGAREKMCRSFLKNVLEFFEKRAGVFSPTSKPSRHKALRAIYFA